VSFYAVQAIVAQHHEQVTLGAPHALRAVIGTALFLTVLGALALALGALVRNTAGGIAAFVFLILVLPGLIEILPQPTAAQVNEYLPSTAGTGIASIHLHALHLPAWGGLALFTGYALAAVAAAAVALRRRDA
jgi:hypothetical protein